MTPDGCLKVFAFLEAVWTNDDQARAHLDSRVYAGGRMKDLLVSYLEELVRNPMLLTANEESAGRQRDPNAQTADLAPVLVDTLREWARTGGEEATVGIAHSVIAYLLVCVASAQGDLPAALPQLRNAAARSWPEFDFRAAERTRTRRDGPGSPSPT
jgi:hypothetical protein